jgi:hypothetical protein
MATGVFSTSSNLGGIVGITLTSVMLGRNPGVDAVRGIFVLYAASAYLNAAIATRLEAWPTTEHEVFPVGVGK